MENKSHRALLALYCLLSLCARSSAKPVNHARHLRLPSASIANLLSATVGPEVFAPQEARSRQDRAHAFVKRASTWTVQAGDTGNGIALRLSIDFIQLAFMNPSVQWNNLQIGQVLNIPCDDASTGARMYTVVAGDTGNAIAAANGITFAQLDAFNPDVNWYNLQIGQTLLVPAPGVPATSIAGSANTASLEHDATVPATQVTSSTSTYNGGKCDSTTTSSTITISTTITMPAVTGGPPSPSTPTSLPSENTPAATPVPANMNEKSPFLTPGGSDISERSLEDQNNILPKLIKLRLIRNDQATDTDPASQAEESQDVLNCDPTPSASSSSSGPSTSSSSAAAPTTYTVQPGQATQATP
ncbi:hypothetical protein LTR70_000333 [Exophiala xenobiotica]|uniref:LysM domain-containing protein n=1 Tax=Lithohypha guttulata TaxID=1690604 RepID=A0ABR0KPL1_9EURO|nr:hypothetical protein LTR24_000036 [Lithohypha guttulata]KAK5330503.1 hypothetical protein LTR70_000333 [Exophiala xenobiotica]